MQRKKTAQKTKSSPTVLCAEDKVLLDSLIKNVETINKDTIRRHDLNPNLATALVERLPLDFDRTPELLEAIAEAYHQKEVRKAVRRIKFKLKQRGVAVSDVNLGDPPAFRLQKAHPDKAEAYVGAIDGSGSRAVLIVVPQLPQGIGLGVGVISDEAGILEYVFGRYSKKQAKEMQALFFEKLPFMVETSLSHAAALLEQAHSLTSNKGEGSGDYNKIRKWLLEHASPLDNHPVYDILTPDSISRDILTDSQITKLLFHPLIAGWTVPPEGLKSVTEEIDRAEKSPILLSGIQKVERIAQIKEASIRRLYSETQRDLMSRRLEEMGYLFCKLGEEELARICVRSALSFQEKDSLLKVNAFLKALLEKSLHLYSSESPFTDASRFHGPSASTIVLP